MRILTPLILFITFLASCSTKEKELPSYFCNENLERYFAGNDSLPIININPNDSFGVIRKSVDSLYKLIDINEVTPTFKFNVLLDSGYKPLTLKGIFFDYDPFDQLYPCFGIRLVFEIRLNSIGQLLIEGELGDTQTVRHFIFKNIMNYGKNPNYASNPQYAVTSFQWDIGIEPKYYKSTLKSIIGGYKDVLLHLSYKNFQKPLCELNANEFDSLSESIPFRLSLGYPETDYPILVDTLNYLY